MSYSEFERIRGTIQKTSRTFGNPLGVPKNPGYYRVVPGTTGYSLNLDLQRSPGSTAIYSGSPAIKMDLWRSPVDLQRSQWIFSDFQ
eukprot:1246983-Amorphochlora_amoeboformis.AAC.1